MYLYVYNNKRSIFAYVVLQQEQTILAQLKSIRIKLYTNITNCNIPRNYSKLKNKIKNNTVNSKFI